MGDLKLTSDTDESLIETLAGFDTDDQQIEPIGQGKFEDFLAACDEEIEHKVGAEIAESRGTKNEQNLKDEIGRPPGCAVASGGGAIGAASMRARASRCSRDSDPLEATASSSSSKCWRSRASTSPASARSAM